MIREGVLMVDHVLIGDGQHLDKAGRSSADSVLAASEASAFSGL